MLHQRLLTAVSKQSRFTLLLLLLFIVFLPTMALGAVAVDTTTSAVGSGVYTTCNISLTLTTHGANELIVVDMISAIQTPNFTGPSGGGLTWTKQADYTNSSSSPAFRQEIWTAFASSTLTSQTITLAFNNGASSYATTAAIMDSYSGVDSTTPLDAVSSSGTVTTSYANDYVAGYAVLSGSTAGTAGSGYTMTKQQAAATGGPAYYCPDEFATSATAASGTNVTPGYSYGTDVKTSAMAIALKTAGLSSLSFSPSSVMSGSSSTGTVAMTGVAPTGGQVVTLSSGNAAVTVPSTVTIPAGQSSTTFTATTSSVTQNTAVTVTASAGGLTVTGTLTVTPWIQSVSISPSTVTGGGTAPTGTVTLNAAAPSGGETITLSSSNTSAATVPASVVVAAGSTTATFSVTTSPVSSSTSVTITGSDGTGVATATLTVVPWLQSLAISPTSVTSGSAPTGTVTLSSAAPTGGLTVNLSSSNSAVAAVPTTMTVAAGSTTGTFSITTFAVSTSTNVTISASYGGVTSTASLTVIPLQLSTLSLSPTTVIGATTNGTLSTGTITLNGPAMSGGVVVYLSSSNPSLTTLPATVTVPAGATTNTFTVSTGHVTSTTSVTITASSGGISKTASLTVNPWLSSLTASPTSLVGGYGHTSTATLTLNAPAPTGGLPVAIASSDPSVSVPSSVTVPAGSSSSTFTITTNTVTTTIYPYVSATYDGLTVSAGLAIEPLLASVSLNAYQVTGGFSNPTGTVTLNGAAPTGGAAITLSSDQTAAASVPTGITIAAGATTGTFTVTTYSVSSPVTAHISASFGGVTSTASLIVNPLQVGISVSPTVVIGGNGSTGTVTLNQAAPTGGAVISLTSAQPGVASVPSTVTIAAGSTSATFSITTSTVTSLQYVTLSASYDGLNANCYFTVEPLLSTVTVNPTSVVGGAGSTGTVTLNAAAPTGGVTVTLTSNNAAATVPSSVTVAAGSTTATFPITTTAVSTYTVVTITGSYAGASASATLTVEQLLSSMRLNPYSVYGGNSSTATVYFNGAAPAADSFTVTTSNSSITTVPSPVSFSVGATSASFTVNTSSVTTSTTVTISAVYNGVTVSSQLTIVPLLQSITLSPTTVLSNGTSTATVTLTTAAPTGGQVVNVGSSNTSVATTAVTSITIPAGSTSGTFVVNAAALTSTANANITASAAGSSVAAQITVSPLLSSMYLSPTNIVNGDTSTGNIYFNLAAPAGASITLTSSNTSAATVPATVTPTAGNSSVSFTINSSTVTAATPVTISASYGGVTLTQTLTVYPTPVITQITLWPTEVTGGTSSTATIKLSSIAPAAGLTVNLSSSNTGIATVPSTVTFYSGSTQATATVTTIPTASTSTSTISATYGGNTVNAVLTVDRPEFTWFSISPNSVPGGTSTTGTLHLNGPAPTGGVTINLSVDTPGSASFPPSWTIPAGQQSSSFPIAASTVVYPVTVNLTAVNSVASSETYTEPLSIYVTDIHAADISITNVTSGPTQGLTPSIVLNWDQVAVGNFVLYRNGAYIANLPMTAGTYTDTFPVVSGTTYRYDLYDGNSLPSPYPLTSNYITAAPLSSEQAVPYIVEAAQDQAVDSRVDRRYSSVVYLNHQFGSSAYKGGLFVGYNGDPSKIGRSYAQFNLGAPPTSGVYRTGKFGAYLINGDNTVGSSTYTEQVGLQTNEGNSNVSNVWTGSTLDWSNQPVTSSYEASTASQYVSVTYTPTGSPVLTQQWCTWNLPNDISTAFADGSDSITAVWASTHESSTGWVYFAKSEYHGTANIGLVSLTGYGPKALHLWSVPTLVNMRVPSPVALHGASSTTATGWLDVNAIGITGSVVVTLTSSDPDVVVPSTVTVSGLNQTFPITVSTGAGSSVTITASYGGATVSGTMQVTP